MITFNNQIQELVKEFNIKSRANVMLFKDSEVAEMLNIDRFQFVIRCNQISQELVPLITPYHNKPVVITEKNGNTIHGKIETSNNVVFRTYQDGSEGIALWINTGDKSTTHLYNAENIQLEIN